MKHMLMRLIVVVAAAISFGLIADSPAAASGESYALSGDTLTVRGGNVKIITGKNEITLVPDAHNPSAYSSREGFSVLTDYCSGGLGQLVVGVSGGKVVSADSSCFDSGDGGPKDIRGLTWATNVSIATPSKPPIEPTDPRIKSDETYEFNVKASKDGDVITVCKGLFYQFSASGCVEFNRDKSETSNLVWTKTMRPTAATSCGGGNEYTYAIQLPTTQTIEDGGVLPARIYLKKQGGCDIDMKGITGTTYEKGKPISISNADKLESLAGGPVETEEEGSSNCKVEGGLGWMLCPLLNTMASINDYAWNNIIERFLQVEPLSTSTGKENGLYQAWAVMRNIANVMFVIAFLFIIYSQLTSMGVSNYGIKKMLPRLIMGAILVNTSYWLAAIAVDASNVAGASIYQVMDGIADAMPAPSSPATWQSVTAHVLAGTAVAAGIAMAGLAVLLPLIVSAAFLILGLLATLAFRHAILLVLIVAAPLAAIAYMMPNTDKFSKSWWGLFKLLLLLYPLIAFVVSVSTLAGMVIFNAAGDDVALQIAGLAATVAGIAGIPLLVKATSGALGRLGFRNPLGGVESAMKNRAKGVGGRVDKRLAAFGANQDGTAKYRRFASRHLLGASRRARRDYRDKQKEQAFDAQIEAGALGSRSGRSWNNRVGAAQQQLTSTKADVEIEELKTNQELHLNAAVDNLRLGEAKAEHEALEKELKAGKVPEGTNIDPALAIKAQAAAQNTSIEQMRGQSADRVTSTNLTAALETNNDLAKAAAGIDTDRGIERVRASAIATQDKETAEAISNRISLMENEYKADDLANQAAVQFKAAAKSGDTIGTRAATQILARQTGSYGVGLLESAMEDIEKERFENPNTEIDANIEGVMGSVKYDLAASGLKGKSSALDTFAVQDVSFTEAKNANKTATRLNHTELAGQTATMLKHWKENHQMTAAQAQSVINAYEKGTLPLDGDKLEIFKEVATREATTRSQPTSSSQTGPKIPGGEATTPSGLIIPRNPK